MGPSRAQPSRSTTPLTDHQYTSSPLNVPPAILLRRRTLTIIIRCDCSGAAPPTALCIMKCLRTALGSGILATLIVGVLVSPAVAHHSFAMFDRFKRVTIVGTVTDFAWVNPHSILKVDVPDPHDAQKIVHFTIETGSPSKLSDIGWKFNEFRPGDKIQLVINPLRDGRPGGSFVKATFSDGRIVAVGDGGPPLKELPR